MDLENEMYGMKHTMKLTRDLLSMDLGSKSMLDRMYSLFEASDKLSYLKPEFHKLGIAWCKDVESVI